MTAQPTDLRTVTCPFCGETDFDIVGLAIHIDRFPCAPLLEARTFKVATAKESK